ncbi:Rtr1/RPAP2 family-domain-containing protein [Phlyctochytrium arcticum]|nr:Rtr1/RPAP2 family-domain-containing protein [Phlyctochytrium arcticum]
MHKPLVSSPLSGWSSATTPDEEPTGSFQVPTSPGQIGPPRANENVNNEARTRPRRRRKVPTSEAEKELAHSKKMRAKWDKQVFEWQIKLFEPKVESKILSEAAKYLTPKDYEDVIIERISEKLCGYPLCDRPVTQTKGRFHVSRKEQKVVDLSEQKQFCSKSCFAASGFLKAQLLDEPVFMRNLDRLPAVELLPPGCPIRFAIDIRVIDVRIDSYPMSF